MRASALCVALLLVAVRAGAQEEEKFLGWSGDGRAVIDYQEGSTYKKCKAGGLDPHADLACDECDSPSACGVKGAPSPSLESPDHKVKVVVKAGKRRLEIALLARGEAAPDDKSPRLVKTYDKADFKLSAKAFFRSDSQAVALVVEENHKEESNTYPETWVYVVDLTPLRGGGGGGTASAGGGSPGTLPEDVKAALLEVYHVAPARRATYFGALKSQVVDITGDGTPEYLIETNHETERGRGSSDSAESCSYLVLSKDGGAWAQAYNFYTGCDCQPKAQKGAIKCGKKTIAQWSGHWPNFAAWTTRAAATKSYENGLGFLRAGKLAEAQTAMCDGTQMEGDPVADFAAACGLARLRAKDYDHAQTAYEKARDADPHFALSYLGLGQIAESRKDKAAAIGNYEKFLQLSSDEPTKTKIREKLTALKK